MTKIHKPTNLWSHGRPHLLICRGPEALREKRKNHKRNGKSEVNQQFDYNVMINSQTFHPDSNVFKSYSYNSYKHVVDTVGNKNEVLLPAESVAPRDERTRVSAPPQH